MWGNLLSSSEAAKERLANVLEKTGDALTERATAHVARQRRRGSGGTGVGNDTDSSNMNQARPGGSGVEDGDKSKLLVGDGSTVSVAESTRRGDENTGKDKTGPNKGFEAKATIVALPPPPSSSNSSPPPLGGRLSSLLKDKQKQSEMFEKISLGWGSVLEATKLVVESTREAVEKEQSRLQATFQGGPYRRDTSLPLDVEALRDAEVVYITDRIITMSHPAMQSSTNGDITPDRKLAAVGHLLQKRHGGRYMVWNLSEVEYDYDVLDDQVLTYRFPGSPAPPLGLLLKLLLSMESWLKADVRNVAVLHCLTGKGRTSTVLAAFLCWTGEAGFHDPNEALEYIARCKRCDVETLTIPSQRRYTAYFANMLDGVRPSQPPLLLKRIIMSEAPKFGKKPTPKEGKATTTTTTDSTTSEASQLGCAPYLQIFKAGSLVFTTAASMFYSQGKDDLPFCVASDGPISFPIGIPVQGDVLVRCRHLTRKGQRVSMFRAAFHTGYVPPKVLRISKAQLDGACSDKRFPNDFFIDLIFEPCDAATASKHLQMETQEGRGNGGKESGIENAKNEVDARRKGGTAELAEEDVSETATVTATAYDTMLHRDSRFWDVISARRQENAKRLAESGGAGSGGDDKSSVGSGGGGSGGEPMYGPTVGRRRDWQSKSDQRSQRGKSGGDGDKGDGSDRPGKKQPSNKREPHQTFSIGGEFDFLGEDGGESGVARAETVGEVKASETEATVLPPPPKRDELMEALMALDDEGGAGSSSSFTPTQKQDSTIEEEEIVFGGEIDQDGEFEDVATDSPPATVSTDEGALSQIETSAQIEAPSVEQGETLDKPLEKEKSVSPSKGTEEKSETVGAGEKEGITKNEPIATSKSAEFSDALLEGLDEDEAALLSAADVADAGDNATYELDFDDDDAELEDLENFLTKASSKKT